MILSWTNIIEFSFFGNEIYNFKLHFVLIMRVSKVDKAKVETFLFKTKSIFFLGKSNAFVSKRHVWK